MDPETRREYLRRKKAEQRARDRAAGKPQKQYPRASGPSGGKETAALRVKRWRAKKKRGEAENPC